MNLDQNSVLNNENNELENSSETQSGEASAPFIQEQEEKILSLEKKLKEQENKYLYLYAELENYKKRTIKERSEIIKFGWESVARSLLEVLDNLERAFLHLPENVEPSFAEGLKMILSQFKLSLEKQGVKRIESLNKAFDPHFHEAVGQEFSNLPAGIIIQEQAMGYTLYERLLRPARVIVSKGSDSDQSESN